MLASTDFHLAYASIINMEATFSSQMWALSKLNSTTTQMTKFFIATNMRTSNPYYKNLRTYITTYSPIYKFVWPSSAKVNIH
jgi:hypothetical protein